MPILVICRSCERKMQVKEDCAGKRVRCPQCQSPLDVPLEEPLPAAQMLDQPDEPAESSAPPRRKKARKRRKERAGATEARVLFSLGSLDFTPVSTFVFGGATLALVVGIILLFTLTPVASWFSSDPEVKVVDVYTAVNGLRYTDIGERVLNRATVAYTIPGNRKLMVTRENPEGRFLLVTFKIKYSEVQKAFPGPNISVFVKETDVELEADGEKIQPLFVTDQWREPKEGYRLGFNPPREEPREEGDWRGPTPKRELRDYLGPGLGPYNWTHEGTLTDDGNIIRFEGKGGMVVTTELNARDSGSRERARPEKKRPGEFIVDSPDSFINVSCNKGSFAWLVNREIEQPNEIARKWEISCLFPRPKGAGKEYRLRILGTYQTVKLPMK
jgi:hypothetical protein